ncbi:MAG: GNAT family N-acetyltransferase [Clostridiales bacterium]|nr:GNAT family N-acetyltransferase [Clostridiales bacterium]
MLVLKPITMENLHDFSGTEYDAMTEDERREMIENSLRKSHQGRYFEMLAVYRDDAVVGFMNLFAQSEHIISCGPEIKADFRRQGLAALAETQVLRYAKDKGYTVAVGRVREDNAASIALHEKLGFELALTYTNPKGKPMRLYVRAL